MTKHDRPISLSETIGILSAFRDRPCTASDIHNRMPEPKASVERLHGLLIGMRQRGLIYSAGYERDWRIHTITARGVEALELMTRRAA